MCRENAIKPLLRMRDDASRKCGNPFCAVQFPPSGPAVSPKRFCSAECTRTGWALRKVAELIEEQPDAKVLKILRGAR